MVGAVDPVKLEAEADALLLKETGQAPPDGDSEIEAAPATGTDDTKDDLDKEKDTSLENGEEELSTDAAPGEETPDSEDLTEGLTLENASERIQNAQARMHQATQEAADVRRTTAPLEEQITELKATVDKLERQAKEAIPSAASDLSPVTDSDTESDYAELEALQVDYPDVIKPVLAALRKKDEQINKLQDSTNQTANAVINSTEKTAKERHDAAITDVHSDAFDIVETDDFQGWLARQPSHVARITKDGTAQDIIWLMDQYKATDPERFPVTPDTPATDTDADADARLAAARQASNPATPGTRRQPSNGKPKFTQQQIKDMSPEEFARREPEIDAAMAKGLVY